MTRLGTPAEDGNEKGALSRFATDGTQARRLGLAVSGFGALLMFAGSIWFFAQAIGGIAVARDFAHGFERATAVIQDCHTSGRSNLRCEVAYTRPDGTPATGEIALSNGSAWDPQERTPGTTVPVEITATNVRADGYHYWFPIGLATLVGLFAAALGALCVASCVGIWLGIWRGAGVDQPAVRTTRRAKRTDDPGLAQDVTAALDAIADGVLDRQGAVSSLASHQFNDVVAELCLWIEDTTDGMVVNGLIGATTAPLPTNTRDVVAAVLAHDPMALNAAFGSAGGQPLAAASPEVLDTLLAIVVAFRDGRFRIYRTLEFAKEFRAGRTDAARQSDAERHARMVADSLAYEAAERLAGRHRVDGVDPAVAPAVHRVIELLNEHARSLSPQPAVIWASVDTTLGETLAIEDQQDDVKTLDLPAGLAAIMRAIVATLEAHHSATCTELFIRVDGGRAPSAHATYENWLYDPRAEPPADIETSYEDGN